MKTEVERKECNVITAVNLLTTSTHSIAKLKCHSAVCFMFRTYAKSRLDCDCERVAVLGVVSPSGDAQLEGPLLHRERQ
jgi:hypothetical protein